MTVAELLAASWAAHERGRQKGKGGPSVRITRAKDLSAWQEAYEARKAAHEQDPEHLDQAWADEAGKTSVSKDTHAEMMQFYKLQGVAGA